MPTRQSIERHRSHPDDYHVMEIEENQSLQPKQEATAVSVESIDREPRERTTPRRNRRKRPYSRRP